MKNTNMKERIRFIMATHPLLFPNAFGALQRLAPAISNRVDNPVALLFTGNKILLFEDTKMVRKFRVRDFDDTFDDTDTERLGEK